MIRRLAALAAAGAALLAAPAFGPVGSAVLGHAQLVTSVPGAGEVVAGSPPELRLVFSERLDPAGTRLELLDPAGSAIVLRDSRIDPADPYSFRVTLPPLDDGVYSVAWQGLSAADGHLTSGSFTFGVGAVSGTGPDAGAATTGAVHGGHDAGTAIVETELRVAADGALLLAFGLPAAVLLVVRPRRLTPAAGLAGGLLLIAGCASAGLLLAAGLSPGIDLFAYAGGRTGSLLLVRAALAIIAGSVVRLLMARRPRFALLLGGAVAGAGLVLVALGGHAAAWASPAPVIAMAAHLGAVGIWLTGVATLAWVAILQRSDPERQLGVIVERFSGVALVAGGVLALTGLYADWIQTRSLVSLASDYERTLVVKLALSAGAFGLGALHYLRRPSDTGFRLTIGLEAIIAGGVLVATAVLASGSPPAAERPIAIAQAVTSAGSVQTTTSLQVAPGRPGPSRLLVTGARVGEGQTVELQLVRLDTGDESRIPLRALAGTTDFVADGSLLPAHSRWDAAVVVRDAAAAEVARSRFTFALDATGIAEGRALPPVDPATLAALALVGLGILGVVLWVARVRLPRTDAGVARLALPAGGAIGIVLGLALLVLGDVR